MLMKLPTLGKAHIKVMTVSLEVANAILPSPLYTYPMPTLGATLDAFKAMLDSDSGALKD